MSSAAGSSNRRSGKGPELGRVAVGVDGNPGGRDAAVLAAALVRATGADATLIAVLSDPLMVPLPGLSWKELHKQAETALAELRQSLMPDAHVVIETDVSIAVRWNGSSSESTAIWW